MRRLIASTLMAAWLAGCQMAAPPPQAPAEITTTEIAPVEAVAGSTTEAPPAEITPPPDIIPEAPPEPPALALQRAACREGGGQLMPRAAGIYACVHPTRDAGRSCTAAADCEGLCLARSGTCAPLAPLYGCQEVFTARGRRETLCLD